MRIALVGNQDNNAYRLALWVRAAGHDAHLYMMQREPGPRGYPEAIDAEVLDENGHYPDWIHPYDDTGPFSLWHSSKTAEQIAREFDAIVTSGGRGLMAVNQLPVRRAIHLSLGEDAGVSPLKAYRWGVGLRERLACVRMRQGMYRARQIIAAFRPTIRTIYRLRLEDRLLLWGYPEDIERNRARVDTVLLEKLTEQYASYDRVFLWLSRLNFLEPEIPDYKGPERLLEVPLPDLRHFHGVMEAEGAAQPVR